MHHCSSRSSKNLTSLQSYNFVGKRLAYIQTWGRLRNGQNPRTLDYFAGKMMMMRDYSRPNGLFWILMLYIFELHKSGHIVFIWLIPAAAAVFDALKCILMRGMLTSRPSNDQRNSYTGIKQQMLFAFDLAGGGFHQNLFAKCHIMCPLLWDVTKMLTRNRNTQIP